jgi:fumarate reductase flavoprotein subunit
MGGRARIMKGTYESKKYLSRRAFIKETAAGAVAAGGIGLSTGGSLAEAQTSGEDKKYSFETPPPPIAEEQIQSTVSSEIVVVGAGTAGLHAALAASHSGAKVTLIEKMAVLQARGGDNTAINSKIHKKLGIEIDKRADEAMQ